MLQHAHGNHPVKLTAAGGQLPVVHQPEFQEAVKPFPAGHGLAFRQLLLA